LLTFVFSGIKVFSFNMRISTESRLSMLKSLKVMEFNNTEVKNVNSSKSSSYCRGEKNLNPKSSGFLRGNVGDHRFLDGRSVDHGS
jgi:hypothetical protein